MIIFIGKRKIFNNFKAYITHAIEFRNVVTETLTMGALWVLPYLPSYFSLQELSSKTQANKFYFLHTSEPLICLIAKNQV